MAPTFYITDASMLKHRCEWDSTHIEIPERLEGIIERISSTGLETQCTRLPSRLATENEILAVHTRKYYETIKASESMDLDAAEKLCTHFEDLYLNQHSYDSAMLSAGCALTALDAVLKTEDAGCGFCIFNNVAICAKEARKRGVERVLIIDWDVHAGQGTQYCIEGDPGIKLVSIHRYEDGCFWPNLPESGIEQPYSNTINVPLDVPGYGNFEYAAFIDVFVRPIVADYKPELILVSCGYDAGYGDREGEMRVTPAAYGHMTGTLASLGIPLLLLLEGGYFIDALPYHAERTIEALTERKPLNLPLNLPNEMPVLKNNFIDLLFACMRHHINKFPTFKAVFNCAKEANLISSELGTPKYRGTRELEYPFPTRDVYPPFTDLEKFKNEFCNIVLPPYDQPVEKPRLKVHVNSSNDTVYVSLQNDSTKSQIVTFVPSANMKERPKEALFFYYLVYLPLSWSFSLESWDAVLEVLSTVKGDSSLMAPKVTVSREAVTVLNCIFIDI
uniref:Hist_deacetyl domain-containing protein n=1 Tax=Panagrellus redivivus TaxID=6233 RepID=A0A7E4V5D4_PANRE